MAEIIFNIKSLPKALKYRLLYIGLFYLFGLILSWLILTYLYPNIHFLSWLFGGMLIQGYQFWDITRFLHLNRSENNPELYGELGLGTILTLFRGFLLSVIGGFIFITAELPSSLMWIIALLYTFAALTDRFDGYLARINKHTTIFGREIDMRIDALGILILSLLAWLYGKVGVWYILVGLSYYIFAVVGWIRQRKEVKSYPLSDSKHRRVLAGMQMGFLAVSLWPIFTPAATSLVAFVFGIPLLVTFLRDLLVMTGKIHPRKGLYANLYSVGERLFFQVMIPGFRVLLFVFFCYYVMWDTNFYNNFSQLIIIELSSSGSLEHSELIEISVMLSVGAIITGVLARVSALYLLLLTGTGLSIGFVGSLPVVVLLVSSIIVVYGAGKYNIWNPEDAILHRKDGEQESKEKEIHN